MRFSIMATVIFGLVASPSWAASSADTMKACAAAWKSMSPADQAKTSYKTYSAACLKNHGPSTPPPKPATPQAQMKTCAAKWNAMKSAGTTGGQTYAQFSSTCMKK
ncbi:MAG TPA: hypothetical protein VGI20_05980 [Rhizomicrobium sp.]